MADIKLSDLFGGVDGLASQIQTNKEDIAALKTSKLNIAGGTMTGDLLNHTAGAGINKYRHVISPGGGQYRITTSAVTGALKIALPVSWTNTMMSFWVDVFDYADNRSTTFHISGYNYSSTSNWQRCTATQIGGNRTHKIQFGHDGTKCCVYIGDITTVWSYPQVTVRDFQYGYGDTTTDRWNTGWSISFTTELGAITATIATCAMYGPYNKPTSADLGLVPLAGGTMTGNLVSPSVIGTGSLYVGDSSSTYRARMVLSSDVIYYQGGKADSDATDQKICFSGYMGRGLTTQRSLMATGVSPVVRWGSTDYNMYHEGNKQPTPEVPIPDVWIPFVDNLRMITGAGEEIAIGNEVIGTKVSFSRASTATYIDKSGVLRTADVNEPRFEKEGLLIEGQSTNLTTPSEGWSASSGSTGANVWVHTNPDSQGWRTVTGGTDTGRAEGCYRDFATNAVLWGTTSTFSLDIKKTTGFKVMIRSYNGSNADGLGNTSCSLVDGQPLPTGPSFNVTDMGDWLRVTMTRTFVSPGTSIFRIYPFGANADDSGSLTYRRVQVEALPFASSYIPTSGSTATRAPDYCNLQVANNIPLDTVTIAARYNLNAFNTSSSGARNAIFVANAGTGSGSQWTSVYIDGSTKKTIGFRLTSTALSTSIDAPMSGVASMRIDAANATAAICDGNGVIASRTQTTQAPALDYCYIGWRSASTNQVLWGHIKNFRIWHQALSDDQLINLR